MVKVYVPPLTAMPTSLHLIFKHLHAIFIPIKREHGCDYFSCIPDVFFSNVGWVVGLFLYI
jgi:hypothetical protein